MKYPVFSTDLGVSKAHPVEFSVTSTVSLHTVDVLFAVLDILEKHRIRVAKQNAEQPAADVSVLFQLHHPQEADAAVVVELDVADVLGALLAHQLGIRRFRRGRVVRIWVRVDRLDPAVTLLDQRDHALHLRIVRTALVVLAAIKDLGEPHRRFRRCESLRRVPVHDAVQIVHRGLMLLICLRAGLRIPFLHGQELEEVRLDLLAVFIQIFVLFTHFTQLRTVAERKFLLGLVTLIFPTVR